MKRTIEAFVAAMLVLTIASSAVPADGQHSSARVPSTEIGQNIQIIGRLGHPLGTVLTIQGRLSNVPLKDNSMFIQVTEIEGQPLKETPLLSYSIASWGAKARKPELSINNSYRMRVYEDGGMKGIPAAAMSVPVQTTDYHFSTWLVIIEVLK